jgi:hypothetical protein
VFADDANHDHAYGEFFFDEHSDERSCGKPTCIGKGGNQVVEVLHDLAYRQKPDVDFYESDKWSKVFEPVRDEDDSKRSETDIGHPCKKNEYRKNNPFENIRVVE